jgi:hypothetical protein
MKPTADSSLPTPRDYAEVHHVDAVCNACSHWTVLNVAALIAAGHGDVQLIKLPLRCGVCGRPGIGLQP